MSKLVGLILRNTIQFYLLIYLKQALCVCMSAITGTCEGNPANTRRWSNTGLTLAHYLRRWPNVSPTLDQHLVFAGNAV